MSTIKGQGTEFPVSRQGSSGELTKRTVRSEPRRGAVIEIRVPPEWGIGALKIGGLRSGNRYRIVIPGARALSASGVAPKVATVGILRGASGPLTGWPFQLLRDGQVVSPSQLGHETSKVWISGEDGAFAIHDLPAGEYRVEAIALQEQQLAPPEALHQLTERSGTPSASRGAPQREAIGDTAIEGTLGGPGGPLGGWTFQLLRDGNAVPPEGLEGETSNEAWGQLWVSGEDGAFSFHGLPAGGEYQVEAVSSQGPGEVSGELQPDEFTERSLTPRSRPADAQRETEGGAALQGTLRGVDGPLGDWPLAVTRDGERVAGASWCSDAAGAFQIEELPPGDYQVEADLVGGTPAPDAPPGLFDHAERSSTPTRVAA